MPQGRFTLSTTDRVLGGVCGGLARYFGLDATLVRVLYVVITVFTALVAGLVLYILLWLLAPKDTDPVPPAARAPSS